MDAFLKGVWLRRAEEQAAAVKPEPRERRRASPGKRGPLERSSFWKRREPVACTACGEATTARTQICTDCHSLSWNALISKIEERRRRG